VTPPLPVTPGEVELPNLVGELQKQAHQIVETAASAQIPLWEHAKITTDFQK
jgi:hypothetical protein